VRPPSAAECLRRDLSGSTAGAGSGEATRPKESSCASVMIRPGVASTILTFGKIRFVLAFVIDRAGDARCAGTEPHLNEKALNAFLHGVMLSAETREELTVTDPCVAVWEAELALRSLYVMPGV
jgi:hypothetical protein